MAGSHQVEPSGISEADTFNIESVKFTGWDIRQFGHFGNKNRELEELY